ncbi:hypothetical protein GDO78_019106 [Eleutherodactylus coqui]|uniref:Uncharacterized protein n=1 Tax=Eleutherodactylus coqui TaxID=57060 RepID=A0A8J6EIU9_ELECQ|nr:hypothetical protein GDO78_019106 [Eleutherodactylus coqui]
MKPGFSGDVIMDANDMRSVWGISHGFAVSWFGLLDLKAKQCHSALRQLCLYNKLSSATSACTTFSGLKNVKIIPSSFPFFFF